MSEEENINQSPGDSSPIPENESENTDLPEMIETSEQSTIIHEPLTIMEVHKHPHHVTHKKKWGEYLLEFFMLFLAVFLGFVAENIRETSVEHHREKEYIQSLVQDLKTDTANLSKVINGYEEQLKQQDTLMQSFDSLTNGYHITFFRLLKSVAGFPDFIYTDGTIQQLKSSGSLRLIRSKNAVDSINSYTSEVSKTFINTNVLGSNLNELDNAQVDFINFHNIRKAAAQGMSVNEMEKNKLDFLISHDGVTQSKFFNRIVQIHVLMQIIANNNFVPQREKATRLILFLKEEYHLENE